MNIPARYCTGYLGDIGVPPPYGPMDFAGWFEAYLGGRWYTFDPRNNVPRIGRVLIAQGRDAADVPITHTFGPNTLVSSRCGQTRSASPVCPSLTGRSFHQASKRWKTSAWESRSPKTCLASSTPRN
jgi:hypothetical protein